MILVRISRGHFRTFWDVFSLPEFGEGLTGDLWQNGEFSFFCWLLFYCILLCCFLCWVVVLLFFVGVFFPPSQNWVIICKYCCCSNKMKKKKKYKHNNLINRYIIRKKSFHFFNTSSYSHTKREPSFAHTAPHSSANIVVVPTK